LKILTRTQACFKFLNIVIFLLALTACTKTDKESLPSIQKQQPTQTMRDALNIGGNGPNLVVIPSGKGVMGNIRAEGKENKTPVTKLISKTPFAMSITEITFAEYDKYCETISRPCPDDKGWGRHQQPVINVSWRDAQMYTKWLSTQTGKKYSLPSEAQWEYAARGGTNTRFWWGNEYKQGIDHCDKDIGGCPEGTALFNPGPVGRFQSNPFGLLDMTSNVTEWTMDCWNPQHDAQKTDLSPRLTGDCDARVIKGGAYNETFIHIRLANRYKGIDYKTYKSGAVGFRVVRSLEN